MLDPDPQLGLATLPRGEGQPQRVPRKEAIRRGPDLEREGGDERSAADRSEQEGPHRKPGFPTQEWDGDDLTIHGAIAMNGEHHPATERADHLQGGEKVAPHVDDPELEASRTLQELSDSLPLSLVGNDGELLSGDPAEEASGELPVPDMSRQEDGAFPGRSGLLDEVWIPSSVYRNALFPRVRNNARSTIVRAKARRCR